MRAYVAGQRAWLTLERLPAYAPDLNPVEPVWGNVKTRELANHCASDLDALGRPLRAGLGRVRRDPTLALSFLRHAGLTTVTIFPETLLTVQTAPLRILSYHRSGALSCDHATEAATSREERCTS
jgi:hypothetical protein